MIHHRPQSTLFNINRGWHKANLHFVPPGMGMPAKTFGPVMIWNDDEIAPLSGFPTHPHQDVEIVTYVYRGVITHEDNLGNKGRAAAGDVQVMSAGSGIRHSEINEDQIPVQLFQIWIHSRSKGGAPRWGATQLPDYAAGTGFLTLASGDPRDWGAMPINADARILAARLDAGDPIVSSMSSGGHAYLVPTSGQISVNGVEVGARDGCLIQDEEAIEITALEATDIVLAQLP